MAWRLRLMRDGPAGTIRKIGHAMTTVAQAITTELMGPGPAQTQRQRPQQKRLGRRTGYAGDRANDADVAIHPRQQRDDRRREKRRHARGHHGGDNNNNNQYSQEESSDGEREDDEAEQNEEDEHEGSEAHEHHQTYSDHEDNEGGGDDDDAEDEYIDDDDDDDDDDEDDYDDEDTDTSTVGTSAKVRLRKRHKLRFRRGREEVYAHHYVYKILADSGIYQAPPKDDVGATDDASRTQQGATFRSMELSLAVLRAMRARDIEHRRQLLIRAADCLQQTHGGGPCWPPEILFK